MNGELLGCYIPEQFSRNYYELKGEKMKNSRFFGETDNLIIKTLDESVAIYGGVNHHFAICNKKTDEVLQEIRFQTGPIKENGVNGVQNIDLLNIVIDNLNHFQNSKYACRENAVALTKLEESVMWLNKRTSDRTTRNVEGIDSV